MIHSVLGQYLEFLESDGHHLAYLDSSRCCFSFDNIAIFPQLRKNDCRMKPEKDTKRQGEDLDDDPGEESIELARYTIYFLNFKVGRNPQPKIT